MVLFYVFICLFMLHFPNKHLLNVIEFASLFFGFTFSLSVNGCFVHWFRLVGWFSSNFLSLSFSFLHWFYFFQLFTYIPLTVLSFLHSSKLFFLSFAVFLCFQRIFTILPNRYKVGKCALMWFIVDLKNHKRHRKSREMVKKNVCLVFSVLDLRKSKAFLFASFRFSFSLADYLLVLNGIYYVCTLVQALCIWWIKWKRAGLSKQKNQIDWLKTSQAHSTQNNQDENVMSFPLASDWNGNYDTNRPKTNFSGNFSIFRFLLMLVTSKRDILSVEYGERISCGSQENDFNL